jgi:putative lipoic acid-binding regulatory protein
MSKDGLDFPLVYEIKIIMINFERNKDILSALFQKLKITFSEVSSVPSKNNTYTSYTYKVKIPTKQLFDDLYTCLAKLPEVKMAI